MRKTILLLLGLLVLTAGCVRRERENASTEKREKWIASLSDSISTLKERIKLTEDSISEGYKEISELLRGFTHVENPRYVEGFTICNGWQNHYPLSSTGMLARMTESESFELVASLSGGTFNRITVSAGNASATSATVEWDQALNYRSGNLNTVAFGGKEADEIGRIVAEASGSPVSVTYSGGKGGRTVTLKKDAAEMIAATWRLTDRHRSVKRMERSLPLYARKIDAYRRILVKEKGDSI